MSSGKKTVWIDASVVRGKSYGAYFESNSEKGWFQIPNVKDSTKAERAAVLYYLKQAVKRKKLKTSEIKCICSDNHSAVNYIKDNLENMTFYKELTVEEEKKKLKGLVDKLVWKGRTGNLAHAIVRKRSMDLKIEKTENDEISKKENKLVVHSNVNEEKKTIWIDAFVIKGKSYGAYAESNSGNFWFFIPKIKDSTIAEGTAIFYFLKRALKRKKFKVDRVKAIYSDNQSVVRFIKQNLEKTPFYNQLSTNKEKNKVKALVDKLDWKEQNENRAQSILAEKNSSVKISDSYVTFTNEILTKEQIQEIIDNREEKRKSKKEKKKMGVVREQNVLPLLLKKSEINFSNKLLDLKIDISNKEFVVKDQRFTMEERMNLNELRSYINGENRELNEIEVENFYRKLVLHTIDEIDDFKILKHHKSSIAYVANKENVIMKHFSYSHKHKKTTYEICVKKIIDKIKKQR